MGKSHRDHLLNDAPSEAVAAVNAMLVATVAAHDPEYSRALAHVPEDDEPVTCVYSIYEIEWMLDLEEVDFAYEDAKREHLSECPLCGGDEEGACDFFDYYESGPGGRAYADAPWVWDDDTQEWDAPGAEIMLIENESTVQLVKSPETWRRGWCSPCYPGQCDSDTEGDVLCYKLPSEYLRGDWIPTWRV